MRMETETVEYIPNSKEKYCMNCKQEVTPEKNLLTMVIVGVLIFFGANILFSVILPAPTLSLTYHQPDMNNVVATMALIPAGIYIIYFLFIKKGVCPICKSTNFS